MTPEEAKTIVEIISNADGGCSYCFQALFKDLVSSLPDLDWKAALDSSQIDFDQEQKDHFWELAR